SARVMVASASTVSLFVESTRNQTRDNPTTGGWSTIGAAPYVDGVKELLAPAICESAGSCW
ncbi:MAG: hypothetical protein ACI91O_001398, partial [Candidatus Poriferisodalaceae bacterium]